jgi:hypothetical protein
MPRQRNLAAALVAAAALLGPAAKAPAAFINFDGSSALLTNTGLGNVATLLVLHNTPTESGSVLWDGANDVGTGDATQQSRTQSAGALLAAGFQPLNAGAQGTTFPLIFNIAQTGADPTISLGAFTLRFQDASGGTLFDADFTPGWPNASTTDLMPVGSGVGSSGYAFNVYLSPAETGLFFGDPTNRIGLIVSPSTPITMSNGGPESFFLSPGVPEPGSVILLGMGMAAAGLYGLAHRRRGRSATAG